MAPASENDATADAVGAVVLIAQVRESEQRGRGAPWLVLIPKSIHTYSKHTPHPTDSKQERALLLRHGPDFPASRQVLLTLPPEETPPPQPACWTVAFSPGPLAAWVAVAGWSGAVHVFSTEPPSSSTTTTTTTPRTPVLSIPPPTGAGGAHFPPQEANLVTGLAWRGGNGGGGGGAQLELLVLRYAGHLARHVVRPPPRWVGLSGSDVVWAMMAWMGGPSTDHQFTPETNNTSAPETLVVAGTWKPLDLRSWHGACCTAMAYERASDRLVVAGGSLRNGG